MRPYFDKLKRVIEEKKRTGGQWDWAYEVTGTKSNFPDILKADVEEKFNLQHWEYVSIYKKLVKDEYIRDTLEPTYEGISFKYFGGYTTQFWVRVISFSFKACSAFALVVTSVFAVYIANNQYTIEKQRIVQEGKELINREALIQQKNKIDSLKNLLFELRLTQKSSKDTSLVRIVKLKVKR